jgi:glutamine amidotransferase
VITIIDYDMGNVGSILNMIRKVGGRAQVKGAADEIRAADAIVLPGVGAFDTAMGALKQRGLVAALNHAVVERRVPVLGVCLGMQLMTSRSEEGALQGLGWIAGEARRFEFDDAHRRLKVPHMGWNRVVQRKEHPIFAGQASEELRFYFVHSYHVVCDDATDVLATADYGGDFVAAFQRENIIGMQYHPEKSHKFGLGVYRNFVSICSSLQARGDSVQRRASA